MSMRMGEQTNTNLSFEKMMGVAVQELPSGKTVRPMPFLMELLMSKMTKDEDMVTKYVLDGDHDFVKYISDTYYVQNEAVMAIFGFEQSRPAYYDDGTDIHEIHGTKYDHITVEWYDGSQWKEAFTVYRGRTESEGTIVKDDINDITVVDEFGQNIVLGLFKPNTQFRVVVYIEKTSNINDMLDDNDFIDSGGDIKVIMHGLMVTYDFNDYLPKMEKEITEQAIGGFIGELFSY